jgi:hypothetical protein
MHNLTNPRRAVDFVTRRRLSAQNLKKSNRRSDFVDFCRSRGRERGGFRVQGRSTGREGAISGWEGRFACSERGWLVRAAVSGRALALFAVRDQALGMLAIGNVLSFVIGIPLAIVALIATIYLNDWLKRNRGG